MNGATGAFPIKKAMSARLEWQITALQAALGLRAKPCCVTRRWDIKLSLYLS
jgi:hypothetical protein